MFGSKQFGLLIAFYLSLNNIIITLMFPCELLHPHGYPTTEGEMPGASVTSSLHSKGYSGFALSTSAQL